MTSTREKIKNVLIGLLLVGMVYLTYAVWFYDSPFGEFSFDSLFDISVQEEVGVGENSDLDRFGIRPLSIAVSDKDGRRGAVYSSVGSEEIYNSVRPDIAQCVRKARELTETDNTAWEEALSSSGVFMDYRADVPVSAIWMWLGSSFDGESPYGRYYLFSTAKRNVTIYIKNEKNGRIYTAQTDLPSETLKTTVSKTAGEPVFLALDREEEDFRYIMQETVIHAAQRDFPVLSAYNPLVNIPSEMSAAALEVFGLSAASPTRYAEQDGTEVYIADRVTLKISPQGIATYTDTREETDEILGIPIESDEELPTLAEKTEAARKLAAQFASRLPGEGGIYIAAVNEGINGTEIIFGRHVDGIPVDMKETLYFASVLIKGKSVRSAKFNLRGYDKTSKLSTPMPERLAAAAIRGGGKTGDLNLRYRDTDQSEIYFAWYVGGIERENKKEA
ncbi:MAG: hypothetical protein IKM21_05770 [Oscillospiraceae bacterium]|nr:hypothetical protein [Oscillospiraceae bacterium]